MRSMHDRVGFRAGVEYWQDGTTDVRLILCCLLGTDGQAWLGSVLEESLYVILVGLEIIMATQAPRQENFRNFLPQEISLGGSEG